VLDEEPDDDAPGVVVDGELDVVESLELVLELLGVLGVVTVGGGGMVDGEAAGVRSPGRSPTRSFRSVHALVRVATSARAVMPSSAFFMNAPPRWCSSQILTKQGRCHAVRLQCGHGGQGAMKIEGAHEIPAPRQRVWDAFLDPEQLRKAIPGCEKLEAIGDGEYKATMKVGVAAVKGTFEGKVRLFDKKAPDSYRMAVEGSGGPGFVRGETAIALSDTASGTRVVYNADVQVGGLIAGVGQRMLGGVSKMMADQFFNRMSELLQAS
jgi:carbon monoxide dehydrogenase subunit G